MVLFWASLACIILGGFFFKPFSLMTFFCNLAKNDGGVLLAFGEFNGDGICDFQNYPLMTFPNVSSISNATQVISL